MLHGNAHSVCLDSTLCVTKLVASLMICHYYTAVLRLLFLVAFGSEEGEREGCAKFGLGEER